MAFSETDNEDAFTEKMKSVTEKLKEKRPLALKEWDERLWVALIDRATVCPDGGIVFRVKCDSKAEVEA